MIMHKREKLREDRAMPIASWLRHTHQLDFSNAVPYPIGSIWCI